MKAEVRKVNIYKIWDQVVNVFFFFLNKPQESSFPIICRHLLSFFVPSRSPPRPLEVCPPLQVRLVQHPCCLVNNCQITLPNITLSRPYVSGCHCLSVGYSADGCTCAHTQNKHGRREVENLGRKWIIPRVVPKHSWTLLFAGEIWATHDSLRRCVALNASHWTLLPFFSLLFGHSDISHYSVI